MPDPLVTEPDNLVRWLFAAAPDPLKLNLELSVVGPDVGWNLDAVEAGGKMWYPLCAGTDDPTTPIYPLFSTRGAVTMSQLKHRWWIPGDGDLGGPTITPDTVIDWIRTARRDPTIAYFIYHALDDPLAKLWRVRFHPTQGIDVKALYEHRYADVTLVIVGEG